MGAETTPRRRQGAQRHSPLVHVLVLEPLCQPDGLDPDDDHAADEQVAANHAPSTSPVPQQPVLLDGLVTQQDQRQRRVGETPCGVVCLRPVLPAWLAGQPDVMGHLPKPGLLVGQALRPRNQPVVMPRQLPEPELTMQRLLGLMRQPLQPVPPDQSPAIALHGW